MPLIYKPRDPNYGVRKVRRRNAVRRSRLRVSVLPETKKFIVSQQKSMSQGKVVDAAVKLYANCRELSTVSVKERETTKLQTLNTSFSPETIAYFQFMRDAMTPGELIDVAIMLYRKLTEDTNML